jgi:hypothetical protein
MTAWCATSLQRQPRGAGTREVLVNHEQQFIT